MDPTGVFIVLWLFFLHFVHEDTDMRAGEQVGEGGGVEQIRYSCSSGF